MPDQSLLELLEKAVELAEAEPKLTKEFLEETAGDDPAQMLLLLEWISDRVDLNRVSGEFKEGDQIAICSRYVGDSPDHSFIYEFEEDGQMAFFVEHKIEHA